MVSAILLLPFIVSFLVTLFLIPQWIKRARNVGLTGKDIHKNANVQVPESGGITVLVGFITGALIFVATQTFVFHSEIHFSQIFSLLLVVLTASFIGFVDDILGWKIGLNRKSRLVLLLFASIPLVVINAGRPEITLPLLGSINLGILYPLLFIPIGVVGATSTYNFLAGFNGLEAGQGIILLSAISLVAYLTGSPWIAIVSICMVTSLFAFLIYNYYPSKVFPGDALTYAVGSLIASATILGNFEQIAIFFFIPYILEVILKLRGKLLEQSFARVSQNGELSLRNGIYSVNHLAIYGMKKIGIKPTERGVVLCVWLFQIAIIIIGFVIFRPGI